MDIRQLSALRLATNCFTLTGTVPMNDNTPKLEIRRLLLGLAGCLAVAALVLAFGALIIAGSRTELYLTLERWLGQF